MDFPKFYKIFGSCTILTLMDTGLNGAPIHFTLILTVIPCHFRFQFYAVIQNYFHLIRLNYAHILPAITMANVMVIILDLDLNYMIRLA